MAADTFVYDMNWNLIQAISLTDQGNGLVYNSRYVYTYDSQGNRIAYSEETYDSYSGFWDPYFWGNTSYDTNGHIVYSSGGCVGCGSGGTNYSYDARGRLINVRWDYVTHGGIESNSDCDVYYHEINGPSVICENANMPSAYGNPNQLSVGSNLFFLTVTDSVGATATDTVDVILHLPPPAPSVQLITTDLICNKSGTALVEIQNYNYNFSYSVQRTGGCYTNIYGNNVNIHCAGDYWVTYSDRYCNSLPSQVVTIRTYPIIPIPQVTLLDSSVFCWGDSALIQVQVLPDYRYAWRSYSDYDHQVFSGSSFYARYQDSYQAIAYDTNGCAGYSNWVSVFADTLFTFNIDVQAPTVICQGDSVLLIHHASIFSGYQFQWMKNGYEIQGANDSLFYAKLTGNYSLKLIDTAGCGASSQNILVQVRPSPNVTIVDSGTYLIAQTATWQYQWYRNSVMLVGDTSFILTPQLNGIYEVLVTDYHQCTASDQYVLNCGASLFTNAVSCHDSCDGSIVANPRGISPYTFEWSNQESTPSITNLCPVNYSLIITDQTGCSDTLYSTILLPSILAMSIQQTPALCSGQCAVLSRVVNGGTPPYQTVWCTNQTQASILMCNSGSCNVIVTDSRGCVITDQTTINIPLPLAISATITGTTCIGCNNGEINLSFNGGTSPYTFTLYPNQGTITGTVINGLPAGYWTIHLMDSNQCTSSFQVQVLEDPSIVSSLSKDGISHLYPNPASNRVTVQPAFFGRYSIEITNLTGQRVFFKSNCMQIQEVNIEFLESGYYIVSLINNERVENLQLIIEK